MTRALPAISIILPVLNEAESINEVVAHVKALAYDGPREIIVVDGGAGADTLAGLVHADVLGLTAPKGRAKQMNRGAAMARGDIFLFLHADTHLPEQALGRIAQTMEDSGVGAGAFRLAFDSNKPWYRLAAWLGNLRNQLLKTPYGDQAQFFRASLFRDMGGFPDLELMEDVAVMRQVRKLGHTIAFVPEPVTTSTRRYRKEGFLFGVARNCVLRLLYGLGMKPERLTRFYRAHGETR